MSIADSNVDSQREMAQEDDESWVPLESLPDASEPSGGTPSTASTAVVASERKVLRQTATIGVSSFQSKTTNNKTPSIQSLQRRVEMRRHLQQHLVHHPLQILWSHFLWHLVQEFWNLELKIRIAILFLAVGAVSKVLCMTTWYLWYPKTVLLSSILLASFAYLYSEDIPRRLESFLNFFTNLPDRIPETLDRLDPDRARKLCVGLFFLPTLLQMRTICFLSDLNATEGGLQWNCFISLFMSAIGAYYITSNRTKPVRDVSQTCLLVLYGFALWISLWKFQILTMPSLAATFFLSTGTLLLAMDDHDNMEWFSQLVRIALRLTLRDVLATVGTSVQEDEMLQLAMLRWIVDYWSYTPPQSQSQTQQTSNSTASSDSPVSSQGSTSQMNQELQWDQLLPMLNVATDQMTSEVHSLQSSQSPSTHPNFSNAEARINQSSTRRDNSSQRSSFSAPPRADDPLKNLQNMLKAMNIDERAKPAVESYRRNVEEFPPTRGLALCVSMLRRCPASMVCLWQILIASTYQPLSKTFEILLLLLPLMALESIRLHSWALALETLSRILNETATANPQSISKVAEEASISETFTTILNQVDPMTTLLSGDDDTVVPKLMTETHDGVTSVKAEVAIPTLILVWKNIENSVGALELSLTAARCAQTGAVAIDFAQNVISLAQFGSEITRHGWAHGVAVIAKEIIFHHQGDINRTPRGQKSTYTQNAVKALQNGQVVAHNLQVLASEDNNIGQVLTPIIGLFGLVGSFFNQEQSQEAGSRMENCAATDELNILAVPSLPGKAPQQMVDDEITQGRESPAFSLEPDVKGSLSTQTKKGELPSSEIVSDENTTHSSRSNLNVKKTVIPTQEIVVEPNSQAAVDSDVEGLAEVMELIADAFEEGVIDEDEKNQFCMKLSENSSDIDVVRGMKTTLQGLLLETSFDAEQKLHDGRVSGQITKNLSSPKATGPTASENINESRALDEDWSPIVESVASQEPLATQPFDYSERLADAVRTRDELSVPQLSEVDGLGTTDGDGIPTVDSSAQSRQDDDENMWVKVGGGIAVLGAVVGGAFLAMNQDNPNNSGPRESRSSRPASTVTIERLDDDGEGDWEPASNDAANRQAQ